MLQGQEVLGGSFGSDTACREANPLPCCKVPGKKGIAGQRLLLQETSGARGKERGKLF